MSEMPNEEWRKVPDWPYEVSNRGRVRTLHYLASTAPNDHILRTPINGSGYRVVRLQDNGASQMTTVHQLVASMFVTPRPTDSHQVHHKDGDRTNNSYDNLEWLTPTEHAAAERKLGTRDGTIGSAHPNTSLTESVVEEIVRLYHGSDMGTRAIARLYGIGRSPVRRMVLGRGWKHVTKPLLREIHGGEHRDAIQIEMEGAA